MKSPGTPNIVDVPALDAELQAIKDILAQVQIDSYALGVHYNVIVDNKLAEKAGYKNSIKYFDHVLEGLPVKRSELFRYGSVARNFSQDVAKQHGMSKLALLLSYATLTLAKVEPDPVNMAVQVPDETGQLHLKVFGGCTARELQAAINHVKHPGDSQLPEQDQQHFDEFAGALKQELGEHSHVTLKAHAQNGVPFVTLEHVPLALLGKVAAALARVESEPQAPAQAQP